MWLVGLAGVRDEVQTALGGVKLEEEEVGTEQRQRFRPSGDTSEELQPHMKLCIGEKEILNKIKNE